MTQVNIFNQLLIWPIINILLVLYKAFLFIHLPGALGWAVIAMTVLIRLVLYPLSLTQLKSAQKMAKLKPEIDHLNQIHKNDKTRLQQEQLKLYQSAGINPAAGCLPLLLQFPILIALYNVFFQILSTNDVGKVVGEINKIIYFPFLKLDSLDLSFFGMNLAHKPAEWQKIGWWLLLIPVITALLQYWQTKLMVPSTTKNQEFRTKNNEEKKEAKGKEEDMGTVMQKQMSIMMPLMIGFFAYSFPLGLSLYWNTFTIFGIIQQYQINKEGDDKNSQK